MANDLYAERRALGLLIVTRWNGIASFSLDDDESMSERGIASSSSSFSDC